ncbi:MAG: hypothetical protein K0R09_2179 [Clostridiales bacterium]|jgi:glycosyltransferase involved in cell wall biosynthesis|nr:hypothetical protein [Clostridiales bacterium]
MTILIPSYEPGVQLLELIIKIKEKCSFDIIIVNDGSSKKYNEIFRQAEKLDCKVLTHERNFGKGHALKTGFDFIRASDESIGVVCADSDGQHLLEDILRVAKNVEEHKSCIVLGSRRFTGKVPLRSKLGNSITRIIFTLATGIDITDTQTGLRGYSIDMLSWLCNIPGERFEYEMNMLLKANDTGFKFHEVNIDTVYYKNNKSSHFHGIKDSAMVYLPILKFCASSLISSIIDFTLLLLIQYLTANLLAAVVVSRVCSSIFNYTMNKNYVFHRDKNSNVKNSMLKYFILVIIVMFFNYSLIFTFNKMIGISLLISKLLAETTIFMFSYWSQRKFVFAHL